MDGRDGTPRKRRKDWMEEMERQGSAEREAPKGFDGRDGKTAAGEAA